MLVLLLRWCWLWWCYDRTVVALLLWCGEGVVAKIAGGVVVV